MSVWHTNRTEELGEQVLVGTGENGVLERTSEPMRALAPRLGSAFGDQGDDFLCTGPDHQVQKFVEKMKGISEVQVTVVGSKGQHKELVMLNRRVRWTRRGTPWEADLRHVLEIVKELPCAGADKIRWRSLEGESELGPDVAKRHKSLVSRANYQARHSVHDPDPHAKDCPKHRDTEFVKRLGRYLRSHPCAV